MPRRVPTRAQGRAGRSPRTSPAAQPRLRTAVLYARVSSKDQEKEGFSIPAQQALLKKYAAEQGLKILEEFVDVETAKRAGRTQFTEMLRFIKKKKTCKIILVEKTDRLYRNLKDWVMLDDMELEIHLVKEGVTLSDDSKSADKFMHGIRVLMAKNYIDNLSEEITKGMRQKAEEGHWPSAAPLGYINRREGGKSFIVPDPRRAHLIVNLFEYYASGSYSLADLARYAKTIGLKGKRGAALNVSTIHHVLRNPIYAGEFIWDGALYESKDPILIGTDLFEEVQRRMDGISYERSTDLDFAFSGMIVCQHCGYAITAELKKKKYVYYHCVKTCTKEPYIREEKLAKMFADQLRRIRLPDEVAELAVRHLKDSRRDIRADIQRRMEAARARQDRLSKRIDQAYEDKLDGRIDEAYFQQKRMEWEGERAAALEEIERLDRADASNLDLGVHLIELGKSCVDLYLRQEASEQRKLLETVISNSQLGGGELTIEFRKPFNFLADLKVAAKKDNPLPGSPEGGCPIWWS